MTELTDQEAAMVQLLHPIIEGVGSDGYCRWQTDSLCPHYAITVYAVRQLRPFLAAARAEGARDMRTKIETLAERADACTDCGKAHSFRQLHHPGQTHSRSNAHSGPCNTWADPDDGHAYSRPAPITTADLRALLTDGGEPQ